jgi:uncharacterized membrane protein YgcG
LVILFAFSLFILNIILIFFLFKFFFHTIKKVVKYLKDFILKIFGDNQPSGGSNQQPFGGGQPSGNQPSGGGGGPSGGPS